MMISVYVRELLFNPAIYLSLLCGYVVWRFFRSSRPLERFFSWFALVLFLLFFAPLPRLLVYWTERLYPVLEQVPKGVAHIVVLGSGGTPDKDLKIHQYVGGEMLGRIVEGVALWKGRPESFLVFSSAGREGFVSQAQLYAAVAKDFGVPRDKILKIEKGRNTLGEAADFRSRFPDVGEIALVSSAAHLPRAKRIFELEGIRVHAAPAVYTVKVHPGGDRNSWVPQIQALHYWGILAHEWGGRAYVELRVIFRGVNQE